MKVFTIGILLFSGSLCFAQTTNTGNDFADKWFRTQINQSTDVQKMIQGQTPEGKPCALRLFDMKPFKPTNPMFYVGVILEKNPLNLHDDWVDSIAIFNFNSTVNSEASILSFENDRTWEKSPHSIEIQLNDNGLLLSATGISDSKSITCNFR